MSYSSSLVVESLDQNQNPTATLTLVGGGLPKQGAAWPIEVTIPTTWYPGNPDDATQQVLVAKDMPSDWTGEWNLTRLNRAPCKYSGPLGDQPQLVSPGFLVDVFEDMARKGQLLRVTWTVASTDSNIARTVVRLGRISKFTPNYVRSTDIEWSISFTWKSRGAQQAKVVSTRDQNVSGMSASLQSLGSSLASLVSSSPFISWDPTIPFSATSFTLGISESFDLDLTASVSGYVTAIGLVVSQLQQVSTLAASNATIPYQLADSAVAQARSVVEQTNTFQDTLEQTPPELCSQSTDAADIVRAFSYFGQIDDQATIIAQAGMDAMLQLRSPLSNNPGGGMQSVQATSAARAGTILATRIARKDDTPESLSMLYYGNVDNDIDILRANGLPWHQVSFDVGSAVVIPVLSTNKGP